ncbi:MAG: O-antigen ligase family protein [Planctomycetaceae bacterium]|nr:O-antigen ligase family protein [Planctomycetaceae bacterium]
MARRHPRPGAPVKPGPKPGPGSEPLAEDGDAAFAAHLGEWLRRVALGLAAALMTARAFWPSEPDYANEAGTGLDWVLAMLMVAGLAVASALVGGTLRIRWSWTDAAVITLMVLVGLSATQALDRRPAINLAWEWGALGLAYVLARSLPRTTAESTALLGALAATAVAVSVYGLYQVGVELPELRDFYKRHPMEAMRQAGINPQGASLAFENRLLNSNEPWSTFALANSLAGYLVGPLVVMLALVWDGLRRRESESGTSRASAVLLAAIPTLVVLICLILTKSRSAYIGLAVALAVLAWRERRRVRPRALLLTSLGGMVVVAALVVGGVATGRLDRLVLTESTKSLRYRWEYWVGAWRVITGGPRTIWTGIGPGNFGDAYVHYKLPQASEEVKDPHNLLLEVWSTAGVWAAVALVSALGLALWNLLGPASPCGAATVEDASSRSPQPSPQPPALPRRAGWLLASAGSGWVLASLVGQLDPFKEFDRWLILGSAWLLAVAFGLPLWRRSTLDAAWPGAAALAVIINLLAAGGIGIPAVALALWTTIALGLNLRQDRGCGRLRVGGGRLPAFGLALIWAALLGTFAGAILPFWQSERAIEEVQDALSTRPPRFEKAEAACDRACQSDRYSALPWLCAAQLHYLEWDARGARPDDRRWRMVLVDLGKATDPPRNPNGWALHRERARVTRELLKKLPTLKPGELMAIRASVVEATRKATLLYPNNAALHAELADASATIGVFPDAAREAHEALRLDDLMPHRDRKLPTATRRWLEKQLPTWEASAAQANAATAPKP